MPPTSTDHRPPGRPADHPPGSPEACAPPILTRATLRWLCILFLVLVIYGTIGPLGLGDGPWFESPANWSWVLPHGDTDYNDVFTNFVVYLPVGMALRLLVRRRGRAGLNDLLLGFSLAALLSYGTELVQQFMPARSANLVDVYVNSGAALFGCILAPWVQRRMRLMHAQAYRAWHTSPWVLLGWATIALTALLMAQPFTLKRPEFGFDILRVPDLLDFKRFSMFAMIGLVVTIAAARELGELRAGVRLALLRAFGVVLIMETLQTVLAAHEGSVFEMCTGVLGGLLGCCVAIRLISSGAIALMPTTRPLTRQAAVYTERGLRRWRPLAAVLLIGAVSYVLIQDLVGSGTTTLAMESSGWVPFAAEFHASFDSVIADLIDSVAVYIMIALLCRALGGASGGGLALWMLGCMTVLGILVNSGFGGHPVNVTPALLAGFSWIVAERIWSALQPRVPQPVPVSVPSGE